jgi:hypothetical protein
MPSLVKIAACCVITIESNMPALWPRWSSGPSGQIKRTDPDDPQQRRDPRSADARRLIIVQIAV